MRGRGAPHAPPILGTGRRRGRAALPFDHRAARACRGLPMIADIAFALIRAYATVWMRSHSRVLLFGQEQLASLPRGRRVYIVLNHSTSYDAVGLFHISAHRFGMVLDREAFNVPVVGRLLAAAGFIALDKRVSEDAVQRAVATVKEGTPFVVSLTEGHTAIGRPGIREAAERGRAHRPPRGGGHLPPCSS